MPGTAIDAGVEHAVLFKRLRRIRGTRDTSDGEDEPGSRRLEVRVEADGTDFGPRINANEREWRVRGLEPK